MRWVEGLLVALVGGAAVSEVFLRVVRWSIGLGRRPEIADISDRTRVPGWVTGVVERLVFVVFVVYGSQNVPTAMMAWLAIKLATIWNHQIWDGKANARAFALTALLAGLLSMGCAYLGGLIVTGKFP